MYKLTIKRQDGSVYWNEHFISQEEAQNWLDEERTRLYWDATYTTEIVSTISEEEIAAMEQVKLEHDARSAAIKSLKMGMVSKTWTAMNSIERKLFLQLEDEVSYQNLVDAGIIEE